jgi:hypothetical protein
MDNQPNENLIIALKSEIRTRPLINFTSYSRGVNKYSKFKIEAVTCHNTSPCAFRFCLFLSLFPKLRQIFLLAWPLRCCPAGSRPFL